MLVISNFKLSYRRGANIEAKRNDGDTPLHLAAWYGQVDLAELLLDRGANIELGSNDGYTPLSYVSQNGKADVVKLLHDRGAGSQR